MWYVPGITAEFATSDVASCMLEQWRRTGNDLHSIRTTSSSVANRLFVNPAGADGIPGTADDDLRLSDSSAAIDAGGPVPNGNDFAEGLRPAGKGIDIGAYEHGTVAGVKVTHRGRGSTPGSARQKMSRGIVYYKSGQWPHDAVLYDFCGKPVGLSECRRLTQGLYVARRQ
jgi:hypothetical protein